MTLKGKLSSFISACNKLSIFIFNHQDLNVKLFVKSLIRWGKEREKKPLQPHRTFLLFSYKLSQRTKAQGAFCSLFGLPLGLASYSSSQNIQLILIFFFPHSTLICHQRILSLTLEILFLFPSFSPSALPMSCVRHHSILPDTEPASWLVSLHTRWAHWGSFFTWKNDLRSTLDSTPPLLRPLWWLPTDLLVKCIPHPSGAFKGSHHAPGLSLSPSSFRTLVSQRLPHSALCPASGQEPPFLCLEYSSLLCMPVSPHTILGSQVKGHHFREVTLTSLFKISLPVFFSLLVSFLFVSFKPYITK